jgi:homoserine kinase
MNTYYVHGNLRETMQRVRVQCVCFIPDMIGKTSDARAVLPDKYDRKDAVFSVGRVAWLVNALATSNIDNLRCGIHLLLALSLC